MYRRGRCSFVYGRGTPCGCPGFHTGDSQMRLLLSCISTQHSTLKKHWSDSAQATQCPLTVLGSYEKPKEDPGGLLCLLEDFGCSQKNLDLKMAAGMADSDKGVFITSFGSIHEVDADLS